MGILVADYGSDSEGASDGDGDDAAGGEIVLEPAEATTAPARGGDGEAGGERERDDAPAGTSTKRALEPETPPEASKYVAYGGGWYDRAGNYCWISPDGTLHLLRPGATCVRSRRPRANAFIIRSLARPSLSRSLVPVD